MEKKQRMFYFGTNGWAGHYARPINSYLPDVKSDDWARFDGAMLNWIEKYGTYSQAKLFGSEWSVYADNARGRLQDEPYTFHYGFITSCYPATEKQKRWLMNWIRKHKWLMSYNKNKKQ